MSEAVAAIRAAGIDGPFACAIVLGTGLGPLADKLEDAVALPFAEIPHFPRSGVSGHVGRLVAGRLEGKRVLALQGRAHYYEHGDPAVMRVAIGAIAALGAPPLLLTNAAGSTRLDIRPPALVAMSDHISLFGKNPLIGESDDKRFVPMTDAYDPGLRQTLARAARDADVALREGVYLWASGPSFETPAEIRMAQTLGADLVGMSTVPEAILARFYGLRVAGLATVTNLAAGLEGSNPSHTETKEIGAEAGPMLERLVRAFVALLD
ncbi:purine-nucleoside phosphorylase [Salinarimonas ramus]|uniref:purine-nucleoside phosphorylase n=1 Tax=Salinarimonas ramus TaxID=690164 RepID=UPI00166A7646|nr:purine-nucleoside phosphorylase [Salinarimonas ramus]